jgi:hypothetical protein
VHLELAGQAAARRLLEPGQRALPREPRAEVVGVLLARHEEHGRVTGLRGLAALFAAAGLEQDTIERVLAELRAGSSLVLVQIAEMGPAEAAARLGEVPQAA